MDHLSNLKKKIFQKYKKYQISISKNKLKKFLYFILNCVLEKKYTHTYSARQAIPTLERKKKWNVSAFLLITLGQRDPFILHATAKN